MLHGCSSTAGSTATTQESTHFQTVVLSVLPVSSESGWMVLRPATLAVLTRLLRGSWYRTTPLTMRSKSCWSTLSHRAEPPVSVLLAGLANLSSPSEDWGRRRHGSGSNANGVSKSVTRPSNSFWTPGSSSIGSVPRSIP